MTTATKFKYNVTKREGDAETVTVFIDGEPQVATKEHPQFQAILDYMETDGTDERTIRGFFDISIGMSDKFDRLSERVSAANGRLYLDGDPLNNALSETILKFMLAGQSDYLPLVNFMEKIEQNPNPHSREHLFRWLEKHDFAITPEGDFLAYKGLDRNEQSVHGGEAMVNGVVIKGQIPNKVGTVIEMPRSRVHFDPKNGCSTGLHAGNWSYASGFSQGSLVRVLINPRDVVSVPTDSGDQKLRVCRYVVLEKVNKAAEESKETLYVGRRLKTLRVEDEMQARAVEDAKAEQAAKEAAAKNQPGRRKAPVKAKAPAKKAPPKKQAPKEKPIERPAEHVFPDFYEQFKKSDWELTTVTEARWVAKDWGIVGASRKTKPALIPLLLAEAKKRLKTW